MFGWHKNYFAIIFKLIIAKSKQIKLQMHCLIFFKKVMIRKKKFSLRTLKFFIICILH